MPRKTFQTSTAELQIVSLTLAMYDELLHTKTGSWHNGVLHIEERCGGHIEIKVFWDQRKPTPGVLAISNLKGLKCISGDFYNFILITKEREMKILTFQAHFKHKRTRNKNIDISGNFTNLIFKQTLSLTKLMNKTKCCKTLKTSTIDCLNLCKRLLNQCFPIEEQIQS